MLALEGIKVLDLSRVLAGPLCTMTLGDLGADVWKVESTVHGDDTRTWSPPEVNGQATYYLSANRNKRSIAINLQTPEGQDLVRRMMASADVLVENMKFGTMERWGLGWMDAKTINPRLIYCSISGYGRNSVNAELPGYDVIAQAESGLMSITGEVHGGPLKHGMAIVDITTGYNATQAILAALFARERTGRGQFIDIALLDSGIGLLANTGTGYINTGVKPPRWGNAHPTIVPYQIFSAADADFVLGCGNDRQFRVLGEKVLGLPELATDERFKTNRARVQNRAALVALLADAFATRSAEHWLEGLKCAQIPAGRVRELDEVFGGNDQQRSVIVEQEHPDVGVIRSIMSPLRLEETTPTYRRPPPLLGEHTEELLSEILSIEPSQIDVLIGRGIVRAQAERVGET